MLPLVSNLARLARNGLESYPILHSDNFSSYSVAVILLLHKDLGSGFTCSVFLRCLSCKNVHVCGT